MVAKEAVAVPLLAVLQQLKVASHPLLTTLPSEVKVKVKLPSAAIEVTLGGIVVPEKIPNTGPLVLLPL